MVGVYMWMNVYTSHPFKILYVTQNEEVHWIFFNFISEY